MRALHNGRLLQWRVVMDSHSFFGTKMKASQLQTSSPTYPQSLLRVTVDNLYEDQVITPHMMPPAWKAITHNKTPGQHRGPGTGGFIPPAVGPPAGPPAGPTPNFGRRTPRGDGRQRNTGPFAATDWRDLVADFPTRLRQDDDHTPINAVLLSHVDDMRPMRGQKSP